jgi:peptidoglycan/xylan/chitin deacetylase (PgdA/CDA1 family)
VSLVVISLDFEMRWGVHDIYGCDFDAYRENLENLKKVIPHTLKLFVERDLRATWATVGAVGLDGWHEYFKLAPPAPSYRNNALAINPRYAELDPNGALHFAPGLIRKIVDTPGQELGSHSFSHVYFREPGVTENDFSLEMDAVSKLWRERFNVDAVSLVFPRNQSAFQHLIPQTGIRIWRGNENAWFFDQTTEQTNSFLPRLFRLTESVSPWARRAAPPESGVTRSSLFIRFNLPDPMWKLHMARVDNELRSIAAGNVLHIWWHPENLGHRMDRALNRLTELLDIIAVACAAGRVVSTNMAGVADLMAKR